MRKERKEKKTAREEEKVEGMGGESEWFGSLKCLFGFDNVAQPWQVFKLSVVAPLGHLSPPALYNLKYQGRTLLYPGYSFTEPNKLRACLGAQESAIIQLAPGRDSFQSEHFYDKGPLYGHFLNSAARVLHTS